MRDLKRSECGITDVGVRGIKEREDCEDYCRLLKTKTLFATYENPILRGFSQALYSCPRTLTGEHQRWQVHPETRQTVRDNLLH